MSYTIQAKLDTWFKLSPAQGSSLADNEKEFFKAGTDFAIAAYAVEDNHLKITLGKDTQGQQIFIKGRNTWYLYGDAVELLHNGQAVDFKPKPAASCGSGDLPRAGVEFPWTQTYPLVNVYITMENHHFEWVNQLFLWHFQ